MFGKKPGFDVKEMAEEYIQRGCCVSAIEETKKQIKKEKTSEEQATRLFDSCMRALDASELAERYKPKNADKAKAKPAINAIYGAMYGDIIGSRFEFRPFRTKEEKDTVWRQNWRYIDDVAARYYFPTDDSIMTIATAHTLLETKGQCKLQSKMKKEKIQTFSTLEGAVIQEYAKHYRLWGCEYSNAGYGGHFMHWLFEDSGAYGSCGNGSAMRISPVGAFGMSYKDTIRNAIASAATTHDHIEGVRGACVEAVCIWMAAAGYKKEEIFEYMKDIYTGPGENIFRYFTLEEAMSIGNYQVLCQFSVPAAIIAVNESESFDEAITNALLAGYDTDTNACIAGAVAGALYGVDEKAKNFVLKKCDKRQKLILEKLEEKLKR